MHLTILCLYEKMYIDFKRKENSAMRAKIVSSMEKCFLDENVLSKPELSSISMLKNERYSFQVCFDIEEAMSLTESKSKKIVYFKVESPLKEYIHM